MPQISAASAQCLSAFGQLCSKIGTTGEEHSQLMPLADIQSQRGRFRVWCGNLGALQQGPSSVDYRLRESPIIQSNIVKLLQQLRSHLTESIAVVTGSRPAFENQPEPEDSSASETEYESKNGLEVSQPKRELEMRHSRIKAILRDLYKLGFKIRNPHIRPVSLHASLHRQVDPETNIDVFDSLAVFDIEHVDELLKQLRKDRPAPAGFVDFLKPRLAAAITRRRRQFKYWERHARKLDSQVYDIVDDEPAIEPAQHAREPATDDIDNAVQNREHDLDAVKSLVGHTLLSQTEASRYNENLDVQAEVGTVVTTASTAIDINGNYVDLPDPPALANEEDFICPYCFVLCEQKYGRKKPWRTHLLHDLQPYLCTYDECSNGDQLFASRKTWAEHEASVHRQSWRCFEHSMYFRSAAGLRGHLVKEHAGSLTNTQMDGLIDLAPTGMADNRDMCPICFETTPFPKGLENHIANHLERFSIFALPRSCVDAEQSFHGSGSNRNGSRSTRSFSHGTLSFSDHGVANDATSLPGLEEDDILAKLNLSSNEKGAPVEGQGILAETEDEMNDEPIQVAERQPYQGRSTRQDTKVSNEDDAEIQGNIAVEEINPADKGKANAGNAAASGISPPFFAGCLQGAQRSQDVAFTLQGLRNAIPKKYHAHLDLLIEEIYTTDSKLHDLAEKAQRHISRVPIAAGYVHVLLPCLAKTLIDITQYYEDRSISRENRWRKMYNEMSSELPGLTLPARFILFNEFLSLIIALLIRSPTLDFDVLETSRSRVFKLREIQNIPNPTPLQPNILQSARYVPDSPEYFGASMHWAKVVFSRPLPMRTPLQRLESAKSQAFGPFMTASHVIDPPDAMVLYKGSFENHSITLTIFLNAQQTPYLRIRSVKTGKPGLSLKGAHELCIAQELPNTIIFTRWSRSENRDKVWARLLFVTWEELVLVYHTFNSLKARSPATVACRPSEFVLSNEIRIFQARIVDDGYHHSLSVRQENHTGCMRLVATVWDGELKDCPVWTAFVPALDTTSEPRWISRRSRLRFWIRDIEPFVFCQSYNANRQRDPKTGSFVIHFITEAGATHFQKLFQSGESNEDDEAAT